MGVSTPDATTKGPNKENSARSIPTAATFAKIREAYFTAKQQHVSEYELEEECDHDETLRSALKEKGESDDKERINSGFLVPVEIRQTDDVGRGLFVNTLVAKGEAVAESTHYGIFYTEKQWNSFLDLLNDPDLVYDVVIWSYVMIWDDEEEDVPLYVVGLDLDEGSLINHGKMPCEVAGKQASSDSPAGNASDRPSSPTASKADPTSVPANIHYIESENKFFAIRDLEPNTELRCDYSLFHEDNHNLAWYDKTWEEVVGEEEEQLH